MSQKTMAGEYQYIASTDSDFSHLEGGKTYTLKLPPGIPASNFWSVIVYDSETKLMICTDQSWPSVYSSCKKLVVNPDRSVDVFFGPEAPVDKESNWVKTIPGKGWYMILNLYDPTEAWFDKTWKAGEIKKVK